MRFMSEWITAGALKRTTGFRALEESNTQSQIVFIGLIGPSGLLLVVPLMMNFYPKDHPFSV